MGLTIAALAAELSTDPKAIGYAGLNNVLAAAALNSAAGAGAGTVSLTTVDRDTMLKGTLPALSVIDNTLTGAAQAYWHDVMDSLRSADQTDLTDPDVQQVMAAAVQAGVLTQAQANALSSRTGSRAEVLWGAGTVVTWEQVVAARGF